MRIVTDNISYIPATEDPLSADVIVVEGKKHTWLYDVGSSPEVAEQIAQIPGQRNVVISHFHPDHMGNLPDVKYDQLYVGSNTYKYTKTGVIVDQEVLIEDRIKLCILPMPSSHAKGCLALEVDGKYLFVGDALYPQHKGALRQYNVQHLYSQMKLLDASSAEWIGMSHRPKLLVPKQQILDEMKEIYQKRESNCPYIVLDK